MTGLEEKLAEKLLEKIDIDKLIERIGLDVLTDKIAERAAELIVEREYPSDTVHPSSPTNPINPINPVCPGTPWPAPGVPPITVMYGVTPTDFEVTALKQSSKHEDDAATTSATYKGE